MNCLIFIFLVSLTWAGSIIGFLMRREIVNYNTQSYIRISAKKIQRSKFQIATTDDLEKREESFNSSEGYFPVQLLNENTFYITEIELGNPPQRVGVLLDTGSADMWVPASNNTYCDQTSVGPLNKRRSMDNAYSEKRFMSQELFNNSTLEIKHLNTSIEYKPSNPSFNNTTDCSVFGTFNFLKSETFISNGTAFSITYADGSSARGSWGHDDVGIHGINITSFSFAVCDRAENSMGILGIGLSGLETTYSGSTSGSYQYENLPLKLRSQGLIEQTAYSVYLNQSSADTAEILFGAVDHNRYTGNMIALPIVNTLMQQGYAQALQLDVTLNSLSIIDNSSSSEARIANGAAAALLDTGTTLTYVPQDVLSSILNLLNAQYSSTGYYTMTCSDAEGFYVRFDFQGQQINIRLSSFLIPLQNSEGTLSQYCMVGIQSSETSSFILGDSFLRTVYMVADLENMEVGLAAANYNDQAFEDIEIMSSGIPSALIPATSLMWGVQSTSLAVQSNVQFTSATLSQSSYTFGTRTPSTSLTEENTSSFSVSSLSSENSRNGAIGHRRNAMCSFYGSLLILITAFV